MLQACYPRPLLTQHMGVQQQGKLQGRVTCQEKKDINHNSRQVEQIRGSKQILAWFMLGLLCDPRRPYPSVPRKHGDASSVNFLGFIARTLPSELAAGAPALSAGISGAGPSDGGLVGADVFSTEVAGGHGGRRRNGVSRTTMAGNLYVYVEYS